MKHLILFIMVSLAMVLVSCEESDSSGGASTATNDGGSNGDDDNNDTTPTDADNDGVASTADCDDNDATKYQLLTGYPDSDNDGYTTSSEQVCSGSSLPSGYLSSANGNDCDDANVSTYQNLSGYIDSDNDGYGNPASALLTICSGASLATGYSDVNTDYFSIDPDRHEYNNTFVLTGSDSSNYFATSPILEIDSSSNVIYGGTFRGVLDLDPSAGTVNTPMVNMKSNSFIAKLNSDGDFQWAAHFGYIGKDTLVKDADLDSSGNIYVVGTYESTVQFDFTNGTDGSCTSNGSDDIFFMKITSDGVFDFVECFGNASQETVETIVVNGTNVYIYGSYLGTVDFDFTAGTDNATATARDVFVMLSTTSGAYVDTYAVDGAGTETPYAMAVDSVDGSIYISANLSADISFAGDTVASADGTAFLGKILANGTESWSINMRTNAFDVAVFSDSNIAWATNDGFETRIEKYNSSGSKVSDLKYYLDVYETNFVVTPSDTLFLVSMNSIGTKRVIDSTQYSWGWNETESAGELAYSRRIAVSPDDKIYASGIFKGTVDFSPTNTSSEKTSTHQGLFIMKF